MSELKPRKHEIVWINLLLLLYLHVGTLYGAWLVLSGRCFAQTFLFAVIRGIVSSLGITGGAHRLWAHKSYKANLPMRIIIMTMATLTYQNHVYEWARDHRTHHKFAETDADPHNAKRGFFFAHVGWLLVKKHPEVIRKGKTIDMSDLEQDGVVMFQKRFYAPLVMFLTFVMPTWVAVYFWGEDPWHSWYGNTVAGYIISLNLVWCINSVAHLYGSKPYDKTIGPVESPMMKYLGVGEGFHNYHHAFPFDYKASEFKWDARNATTAMINGFAKIGWAYDLKEASPEMVRRRVARTGDGTWDGDLKTLPEYFERHYEHDGDENKIWGWGDASIPKEDIEDIRISKRLC